MSGQHFAIEVEQDLLGALMAHAGAIERIEADLQPAHFYRAEHQAIYAAIARLANQGRSCDSLAVVDALEQAGQLEQAGGLSAVVDLEAGSASPANVRRHAEIVIERAMARQLAAAADEIVTIADDAAPIKERIDAAQKRIMALSDTATLGAREPQLVADLMPKYLAAVGERWERKGGGISTGFPDLDRRLGGGLAEGSLVILAGRPSMGKTALALQVAYNVADHGSTALVCSQEMQDTQLIDRAVSFVGRVPLAGLLTGEGLTADDHDKYQAALSRIAAAPLFLDEQGALKPADVRRKARKVKNKRGLAVLVIDYLQLMVGDKDGENRTREVTQITQDLKALAKELSCCVIALSQLNRQVESRPNKRPIMSDLRESGSIEQDADVILAPYRDEYYNADSRYQGLAELLVLKNRQGASGGFVPMSFQGEYTAFGSIFGEWPEEPAAHEKPKRKGRWDD